MGTDIHGVWQAKKGSEWVDIPSTYNQRRHYMLFAWLGNVRNGYGFAGVSTHNRLIPLTDGRGYPDDFLVDENSEHKITDLMVKDEYKRSYDDRMCIWMGDHSHSHVYADEVLDAEVPIVKRIGVISLDAYKEWDKVSQPESWCGGICGQGIKISAPDDIDDDTTHVQVEWEVDCADEFAYFIDEVKRLKGEYGEVRFVFGFDS